MDSTKLEEVIAKTEEQVGWLEKKLQELEARLFCYKVELQEKLEGKGQCD